MSASSREWRPFYAAATPTRLPGSCRFPAARLRLPGAPRVRYAPENQEATWTAPAICRPHDA